MRVNQYRAGDVQFELAFATPPPALAGITREYVGWIDRSSASVCLREVPSANIPLIDQAVRR